MYKKYHVMCNIKKMIDEVDVSNKGFDIFQV